MESAGNQVLLWTLKISQSINSEVVIDYIVNAPNYYHGWWMNLYHEAPLHVLVETGLVLFILWLILIRRTVDPNRASRTETFSEKEVDWLVSTWQPEPLVPALSDVQEAVSESMMIVDAVKGSFLTVRGVSNPVLNLSSFDFLGFGQRDEVKDAARKALEFYGCGSCGPRGFYGTIDEHLKIEAEIVNFMGTQEAISYSDGSSTISSAIPAFAKKGDLIVVDEAVSEPIRAGLNLSRSTIVYFKHNDMNDLAATLQSIEDDDKRLKRNALQQRRFIVVEGIYRNTGEICKLVDVLELKEKFCYRLIVDESLSFGTMGKSGRGLTEHYNIDITRIEMIIVAMDAALASIGGICLGSREIVDHQRLSGAGYCFSASAPPFLSAAASTSLRIIQETPDVIEALRHNTNLLYKGLSGIKGAKVLSSAGSPVIHVALDPQPASRSDEINLVMLIAKKCLNRGYGVIAPRFPLLQDVGVRPTIRVCANAVLTAKQIKEAVAEIAAAISSSTKYQLRG